MNTYKLFDCDLAVTCDTFQCYDRAKYFIGKEDAPKSTLTKVCEKCSNELIENIINDFKTVDSQEDGEFLGKPVVDWKITELKELAAEKGVSGVSRKNKAEIIHVLEEVLK